MLSGVGGTEILLILLVVLILFGSKRIPEFARTMGRAIREFRRAMQDIQRELHQPDDSDDSKPAG